MKKPLTTLAILTLAACSTPPPAPPTTPAVPATPALPAAPACVTEPPDTSDAEAVADATAYYLTCIDASDTSPRDQISRAAPYLTQSIFDTFSTSPAKPDRYWNLTISANVSTTVTVERLYMDNYDPAAATTFTLDRLATATNTAAGTITTYYTFTLQQQADHTYRISDIATTR